MSKHLRVALILGAALATGLAVALLVRPLGAQQSTGINGGGVNGSGGSGLGSVTVSPGTQADVSINSAITTLAASGGGVVQLGAGTYTLSSSSSPIVPKTGVYIVGVVPQLNYTTNTAPIPDSNLVLTNAGGTVLNCSGGPCFQWNKAALGTPASANAFVIAGPTNFGIKNLGFTNCTRAVDGGNTNNPSGWYAEFENLYISSCTDWGFWLTNFQHDKFRRIFTFSNINGGQYYGNDVAQTVLQPGNSVWEDLYNTTPVTNADYSRGLVWFIVQGQQNQGMLYRIQSNRLNAASVTQAATMTNTSANIGVTNSTLFPVGMPVTFSASANGFIQNEIYFVVSSAANVITVSLTYGGAAIVATGATAVNVIHQGYAAVEVIAQGGAALSSHEFYDIDAEAGGTCAIIAQNVQTSVFNISQVPLSTQATQSFCARNLTFSQVFSRASANTSWDGSSGSSQFFGNRALGSTGGGAIAHNPPGYFFDAGLGYNVLNFSSSVYGWSGQTPDSTNMLIPKTGAVLQQESKNAATVTLVGSDSGWLMDNFATGSATITLPAVTSTVKNMQYVLVNPVGTGQNEVVTSTSNFCGPTTARTSITMTPGSAMTLAAENDTLGSYYACAAMLGTYAAGTLTGITP
jgi:hypothetical protein